jgi:hypothetical protein
MAQELLTYDGLAEQLNISTVAAKAIATGLQLACYAASDGRTLVLCELSHLRGTAFDAEILQLKSTQRRRSERTRDSYEASRLQGSPTTNPQRRTVHLKNSRAEIIASLHDRIEEIQRQLDLVETEGGLDVVPSPDNSLRAEFFKIAAQAAAAKQTADRTREELAAYRSQPWWKRTSA